MNRTSTDYRLHPAKIGLYASLVASLLNLAAHAQTISNPSFETDTFTVAPGFISDNKAITGWTVDNPAGAGLSPAAGDITFADNGAIPDGKNVAFITGGTTLSTTITGLTASKVYKLTMQVNATTNQAPVLHLSVDGTDLMILNVYTVGGTAPYEYIAAEFTATANTAALAILNDTSSDNTLLVDNLTIAESNNRWKVDAWSDDSTSGVDSQYFYTHAYSFNTTANTTINGVLFKGVAGANPAISNVFTVAHVGSTYGGDDNTITTAGGGSASLARDFIYSGANVNSGEYESITIRGLTPGTEYVATIYSVGWDEPTATLRWVTLLSENDRLTVNQDQFGNNYGIRVSYRYTAGTNGTAVLNVAPVNPVNVSMHFYGFSNREAVSRNVKPSIAIQPAGSTVSAGVAADFTVSASGIPAPTYQWRFNGVNIPGATSATNSIASVTAQNAGLYDVVVANSVGFVTSVVARLVVGLPMTNPSFETDLFQAWPGYIADNNPGSANAPGGPNVPITGWTSSDETRSGLNPISDGESPFADNGAIPNGKQVAFLQAIGATTSLSQTVTGLTAGSRYYFHYYENARGGGNPTLAVDLGGATAIPAHVLSPDGYKEAFSDVFTATSTSLDIAFNASSTGPDTTALIDNVAIVSANGLAPFTTRDPAPAAGYQGDSATFTAQVVGDLPLNYQWLKDGSPITGATNASLTLTNIQKTAEGDYSLVASNSVGSASSGAAHLTVNLPFPGLYNTGVDDNRVALADNETDPHYQLIVNPDLPDSTAAIVEDSTVFPIVAGPWLANTSGSKWIGSQFNTSGSAPGLYTYRIVFNLTGYDPKTAVIQGRWATDNVGHDILINGASTRNIESPDFTAFTPFAIYGTNTYGTNNVTLVAGTNTLDFIVENLGPAVGYTGLRLEILKSNALLTGGGDQGAVLKIARDGDSVTITWTGASAGQKLQSASSVTGPWTDVANASSPFTTTATGTSMFFRVH
ncbi:MAG TPA: immunoglobulin domain-containing protein [Verrucomicrobiae bacterium]|nr:immunoglobulin domain-containing protein [Verrucomicrobiae bacterium]